MIKYYTEEEFMEERRQKNLIQQKYQKIKNYEDIIKELEAKLKRYEESAAFDKARADRIIARAETVEKELVYNNYHDKENNLSVFMEGLHWIIYGGDK